MLMKLFRVMVVGLSVLTSSGAYAMSCPDSLHSESNPASLAYTTYILDTNILLEKPAAFLDYRAGETVAITEQTLRELENKKTDLKLGWAAREFFRLFNLNTGSKALSGKVLLDNGSSLEILTIGSITEQSPEALRQLDVGPAANPDNRILAAMLQYRFQNPEEKILFVTHDQAFGVMARIQDFNIGRLNDQHTPVVPVSEQELSYTGMKKYLLPEERFQELFSHGDEKSWRVSVEDPSLFYDNQFVIIREGNEASGEAPVALRYKSADQSLHGLKVSSQGKIKNIKPKNLEQRMALELLMDPSVTAVTMFGIPGSGKTLITMAAALQQHEKKIYDKIFYAKPYKHTGGEDELGFLKGDFDEKTGAWHESFVDNLEPIYGSVEIANLKRKFGDKPNEILRNYGMEPLKIGYSRGRSISKAMIIIDEAQNLTPIQLKTLLTRIGEGSKVVLMGDLGQIDLGNVRNPEASPFFKIVNSEAFKKSALSGHTMLIEGLRSPTTDLFNDVFKEIEGGK